MCIYVKAHQIIQLFDLTNIFCEDLRQFHQLDITTFESHEKILDALRNCDLDSAKNAVREN